jgi:methylmalonyl-CoA/ethylmalonyl-CoA epimerase
MPDYWYDHVHLISADPVKTSQFYEEMFGAEKINQRELPGGGLSIELHISGSRILIMKTQSPLATPPDKINAGLEHFGLKTDDIEAAVTDLKAKGVKIRDEVREIRNGVKIAFIWAPDNVLIELVEMK